VEAQTSVMGRAGGSADGLLLDRWWFVNFCFVVCSNSAFWIYVGTSPPPRHEQATYK